MAEQERVQQKAASASLSLADLDRLHESDKAALDERPTTFYGWVRRIRSGGGGTIVFLDLYDGTRVGSLNCVINEADMVAAAAKYEAEASASSDPPTQDELTERCFRTLSFEQLGQTAHLSLGCAVAVDERWH